MKDKENIKIFVIMPFGKRGTQEHRNNSHRYNNFIKPALEEFSNHVKRADEFEHLGNINKDIIEYLFYSQIVIADLSGKNANVFYELGVRHTLRRNSTIPIVKNGESILFDISTYRTIFYDDDENGLRTLQSELRSKIIKVLNQSPLHIDNPVYDTLGSKINDLQKEYDAVSESRNIYERECERLRKIVAEQNDKVVNLEYQINNLRKEKEKKIHTIKVLESKIGSKEKDIIYSKFLTVEEGYWHNNIIKSKNSFVVFISANWFRDNNTVEIQITKLAAQYEDYFILVRFDLEKMPDLATELEIKTIPTVLFVKNGNVVSSFTGVQRDETYQGVLNRIYE